MLNLSWHGVLRGGAFCRAVDVSGIAPMFCFPLRYYTRRAPIHQQWRRRVLYGHSWPRRRG
jgi:hypothetical protein